MTYDYCWAHSPDKSQSRLELALLAEAELMILPVAEDDAEAELHMANPIS